MIKETSNIKILLRYYNYFNGKSHDKLTNNGFDPTTSNSNTALNQNQNYRQSINSIFSNNNKNSSKINISNKDKIKNHINNNKKNINIQNQLEQDYLIYFRHNHNYNNLKNSIPTKIINIKACIYTYLIEKKNIYITLDSLILFNYSQNRYYILNDDDNFYPKFNKNLEKKEINENNISNSTILYYYICTDKIKVIVNLYSKYIDSISINVTRMCSLLMLKYIILLKLREIEKNKNVSNFDKISNDAINISKTSKINLITIEEIEKKEKIYGNGIIRNDLNGYVAKNQTNRDFNNNSTISEIYNYYLNTCDKIIDFETNATGIKYDENSTSKEEGILNFILMEKKR